MRYRFTLTTMATIKKTGSIKRWQEYGVTGLLYFASGKCYSHFGKVLGTFFDKVIGSFRRYNFSPRAQALTHKHPSKTHSRGGGGKNRSPNLL